MVEKMIEKGSQAIVEPIVEFVKSGIDSAITLLNIHSPEIISFGVMACGLGLMIGSFFGQTHKWFSRLVLILWGGVIWRLLI